MKSLMIITLALLASTQSLAADTAEIACLKYGMAYTYQVNGHAGAIELSVSQVAWTSSDMAKLCSILYAREFAQGSMMITRQLSGLSELQQRRLYNKGIKRFIIEG